MIKTYEAPYTRIVGLYLELADGRAAEVTFDTVSEYVGSRTGKGSIFSTADVELQKALEKHPYFGNKYFVLKSEKTKEEVEAENTPKEEPKMETVNVETPDDAKDYLEEKFNVERKKLTSIKKIKDAAFKCGIVFEGI